MRIKVLLFPVLLLFIACGPNADQMTKAISELEGKMYDETTKRIDPAVVSEYVTAVEGFANQFPDHEKTVEWLLKAGEMARNVSQHDKALAIYDRVINDFSSHAKAPQALFLKAFTLDDNMGKKDEAKVIYEEFIQKYPNDEFAASAQFMLKNLYKSNAEIIEGFEQNQATEEKQEQ